MKREKPLFLGVHVVLFLILPAACTFERGQHFATLTPSLVAAYQVPLDRQQGEGWQKLSNEYLIQITAATAELGPIAIVAAGVGAGASGTSFDPANPPAGYSLCHNGHCHSAEGRLVSYEEIEASLGAGGGRPQAVVTLSPPPVVNLLLPSAVALACAPGCGLGRTTLVRAELPLRGLRLEGVVRDGLPAPRFPGAQVFSLTLGSGDAGAPLPPLDAELDVPIDRDHDPDVHLDLALALGPALFDGVDFAAAGAGAAAAPIELAANAAALARVLASLGEGRFLSVVVTRP